jgi:hypothetical protein
VVANLHLARFRPLNFELARGRYLAAGLLFLALSMIPVCSALIGTRIAFVAHSQFRKDKDARGPRARWQSMGTFVRRLVLIILGLVLIYKLWMMIYNVITVGDWREPTARYLLGDPAVSVGMFFGCWFLCGWYMTVLTRRSGLAVLDGEGVESTDVEGSRYPGWLTFWGAVLSTPLLLFQIGSFSYAMYPYVRPEFGGGAAWKAVVLLSDTLVGYRQPARFQLYDARQVLGAIVDQDDQWLVFATCLHPGTQVLRGDTIPPREFVPLQVPVDRIRHVAVVGRIALPRERESSWFCNELVPDWSGTFSYPPAD